MMGWQRTVLRLSIGLGSLLLGLLIWWFFWKRSLGESVVATGPEGGVYAVLGNGLSQEVAESEARFRLRPMPSQGTRENVTLLENREADFAFLQGGPSRAENVRVVAKLYQEVLHLLVREELATLTDLEGARVSVGEFGSGTMPVAEAILDHLKLGEQRIRGLSPARAIEALGRKELDGVMLVSAPLSPLVCEAMGSGQFRLLSFEEEVPALLLRYPYLEEAGIPARSFPSVDPGGINRPLSTIATVGVDSLLVCRKDLSKQLVNKVTREFFRNRSDLTGLAPEAYQIREQTEPAGLIWPVHEGAQAYYRRREPSFMERYAEVIALLLSVAATAWGVLGTVAKWSARRKKNRIDDYYLEVAATFLRIEDPELSLAILKEEESRLCSLRTDAFSDLAKEKLKADESFRIFQDQLTMCLAEIRERIQRV
ncbi:MAG: TAXI family TRAP transporter solute-binding subunit [Verrucomicrobiota bacterium JB023]|nr:TAXI family TRAP transporter solute-binding subunit [Verrucomicrobiota bacterium JB023]